MNIYGNPMKYIASQSLEALAKTYRNIYRKPKKTMRYVVSLGYAWATGGKRAYTTRQWSLHGMLFWGGVSIIISIA